MGKSKTTKTEVAPWAQAQPYLLGAANSLQSQYGQTMPALNAGAQELSPVISQAVGNYTTGTPLTNSGSNYVQSVLGGNYLTSNPYIDQIVNQTNNDVRNGVEASMGAQGLTGGSDYAKMIAKQLAQNEGGIRYQNYANERTNQQQAASMVPGQVSAENALLDPALSAYGAQAAPLTAADQYTQSMGGLFSPYSNQTQTQSTGGLGGILGGILSPVLGFASVGGFKGIGKAFSLSDRNAKTDITRIGYTDGGLPLYRFRYKGDDAIHIGPMAQDVEQMQPHALGPTINGFKSVFYGEIA